MSEYDDALLAKAGEAIGEALHRMHGIVSSCDHVAEASIVLDAVAPLIAAQALREAAEAIRDHGCGGGDLSCHRSDMLLLAIRADELAPTARQTHRNGHESHEQPESDLLGHRDATDNSEDA